ncbi:molybdopterin-dependent oxidoreductase [Helicobacter sp. 11S03491-1]|uniref:molybdopterin-dependent oxidoreductase n=1 Tax=Helicobacter sp. 11S03491-1 TaxID=1476196 RepID=UPI000BA7E129|nr:molybdopterin-dependent oxidoreductase [Helicobacter sp. 11S03491-1]PAF43081.1 trimethylamine-N-oxide reductase [Helicobacter sp. 11S03491-1]
MKRRDFIKTTSILGAGSLLQANKFDAATQTIFDSNKMLSGNRYGAFYAKTSSNQIVNVEPFEGDKKPNNLIYAIPDVVNNESRVEYPMVRKSYLKAKGPAKNDLRGQDEFVRVSWDVALDLAAKALRKNFDKYGPEAIYGECYWWGGSGKVSWGRTVAHRMLKILGGYVEESGDYSTGAGMVIMPHVMGSNTVYESPTKWKAVLKGAKNVVFWGTDPLITSQISVGIPTHDSYPAYEEIKKAAKNKKLNLYSIDVKQNDTQRFMESEFISIIPNTDTAMMIGMAHYLFTSGLYNKDFIHKYTVGFNKFRDYFMGKEDGVIKDVAWASKICGIQAKTIQSLAEKFVKEPTLIIAGRALQRQDHGEQAFWMIAVLTAMLGHIGKLGCGFEFSLSYYSQGGTDKIAPSLKGMSTNVAEVYNKKYPNAPWLKHQNITIPSSRSIQALQFPGSIIDQDGKKIKLPHMRVFYLASGSPLTRHQNVNNTIAQLKKVDTIITADPYWTSMAKMSDIVLPVATEVERIDIDQTNANKEYIIARKPVIDPIGESKSDFWICQQLCKKWGYEEVFTEGKDELAWAKDFYEDARNQGAKLNITMPKFEDFWKQGYVRFTKDDEESELYTRLQDFVQDPFKNKLGTPSGKMEIYSPVIAKFNYDDCKGHPMWFEPMEWLGSPKSKQYPIHIVSPHSRYRLHSQMNNSFIRTFAEISGREPILIHPENAKARNIKSGDIVRLFNDRGEILAGAIVTKQVRKDVAIICEGAWYDPEVWGQKSLCQHGDINVLTIDKGTSKLAQSNIAHTTLVQIEKFKGNTREIRAFSKPKILQSL